MKTYSLSDLVTLEEDDEESWFDEILEDVGWEPVTKEEITNQSRWSIWMKQVWKSPDNKFYRAVWQRPATECQECDLELSFVEVEPQEVTITVYKVKKETN